MNENGEDMNYQRLSSVVKIIKDVLEYAEYKINERDSHSKPDKGQKAAYSNLKNIYTVLHDAVYDKNSCYSRNDKSVNIPGNADKETTKMLMDLRNNTDTKDAYFEKIDKLIFDVLAD